MNANREFAFSHAYPQPGLYPITVLVQDDDGGTGTDTFSIRVVGPADELPLLWWHNFETPTDVDAGGLTTPLDALTIIGQLHQLSAGRLIDLLGVADPAHSFFVDTTNDGFLTALDALLVINELSNRLLSAAGEPPSDAVYSTAILDGNRSTLNNVARRRTSLDPLPRNLIDSAALDALLASTPVARESSQVVSADEIDSFAADFDTWDSWLSRSDPYRGFADGGR